MQKTIYLLLATFLVSHFVNAQEYQHLTISGFNADVIADGTGSASERTTHGVDNAEFAYMAIGYKNTTDATPRTAGFPVDQILTGLSTYPGLTFQLKNYDENNSIRLEDDTTVISTISNGSASGSKKLFLAATSGGGASTVSYVVRFSDNTSQTGSLNFTDWYTAPNAIIGTGIGRINRNNNNIETGSPRIHQYEISINTEHQLKTVSSIEFTRTSSNVPNIFAITAEVIPTCPSPLVADLSSTTTMNSAIISWQNPLAIPSVGYDYYWSTSNNPPNEETIPTGNTTANSITFDDLTTGNAYYFWIRSNCGSDDKGNWTSHSVTPGSITVVYTEGNIPTQYGTPNINSTNYCTPEPTLTIEIPDGYWIASASTSYTGTATNGAFRSEQRTFIYSTSHNIGENNISSGENSSGGEHEYSRTINFAQGSTGNVDFVLRAWRTWGGSGCNTDYSYINNNTWTITAIIEPKPPLCEAPNPIENLSIDAATSTITFDADDEPTGFLIIRSESAALTADITNEISYSVGQSFGGGVIVYNGAETEYTDTTTASNTTYYYHVYAYNYSNSSEAPCLYSYSDAVTESITTCVASPIIVGESNVRTNGAILNWTAPIHVDLTDITYTLEVSTNADFSTIAYSQNNLSDFTYVLSNLLYNTTHYWRVKSVSTTEGCDSSWVNGSFITQSNYSPIAVTGFTEDVIADGIGGAVNSTTAPVDSTNGAANNAYVSNSFKVNASSNAITNGLPLNRFLQSPNIAGLNFILENYSEDNVLRLPEQNVPGTLTFVEPLMLTDIYFAFTSGDGSCTVTAEVLFEDETIQEIPSIAFTNWDSNPPASAPAIIGTLPRVKRDATSSPSSNNFKIFQYGIPIATENQSKLVTGVRFTKTSTGTISPVANIFSISAKIVGACPIMSSVEVTETNVSSADFIFTLTNAGEVVGEGVTYSIQLFEDEAHTLPIGSATSDITTSEYTLLNLIPETTYYYEVVANNGTCDSAPISGSFTTDIACPVPTDINIETITESSVELSWESDGNLFEIEYGLTGFTLGEGITVSASSSPFTISNLPIGNYNFYIRQNCEDLDYGHSSWSSVGSFAIGAYQEGDIPTYYLGYADSQPSITTTSFCTPEPTLTIEVPDGYQISGLNVSYTVEASGWNSDVKSFIYSPTLSEGEEQVFSSTLNEAGSFTFNRGMTFANGETGTIDFVLRAWRIWDEDENTASCNTEVNYISNGSWIIIPTFEATVCDTPEITIENINQSSITIESEVEDGNYEIIYGPAGFDIEEEGTSEEVLSFPHILDELEPNLIYDVYIRKVCSPTFSSDWSEVETFTMPCEIALPEIESEFVFCGPINTNDIAITVNEGETIKWFSSEESNEELSQISSSGTYYVANYKGTYCFTDRLDVEVIINTKEEVPQIEPYQIICNAINVEDLNIEVAEGITLNWYASEEDTITIDEISQSGIYYVEAISEETCASDRIEVDFFIVSSSSPSTDSEQAFCGAAQVSDLQATSNNLQINWYNSPEATEPLDSDNYLTTGYYYVSQIASNGCESEKVPVEVTVNPIPDTIPTTEINICAPTNLSDIDLNTSGNTEIKWYSNADSTTALSADFEVDESSVLYASQTANNCESERIAINITLHNLQAPTASSQLFCAGALVSDLIADGIETNEVYAWYATQESESALSEDISLATGNYYVAIKNDYCESERIVVSVTVITNAAPLLSIPDVCEGTTIANIELPTELNETYKWYTTVNSETEILENTELQSGTYYISRIQDGCVSERAVVPVTVIAKPANISLTDVVVCPNQLLYEMDLGTDTNATINWFYNELSVNPLEDNIIATTRTYYVSQTINGCESDRVPLSITVNNLPLPETSIVQTFCGSAVVVDLVANGIDGTTIDWYSSANSDTPLALNEQLVTGNYYVSQSSQGCESARRIVSVRVVSLNAPVLANYSHCGPTNISEVVLSSMSGVTHRWYSSMDSQSALPTSTILNTGTYYVSRVQYGCETEKAAITVSILDIPDAPTGESEQMFEIVTYEDAIISDIQVNEPNVIWHVTEEDALNGNNPLELHMPLVSGTTYYGIIINENGCVSDPFAVTVTTALSSDSFYSSELVFYPNPVTDLLNVKYSTPINSIEVFNTLGQKVKTNTFSSNEIQIDLNGLASGTYMLKVYSEGQNQIIKVLKR